MCICQGCHSSTRSGHAGHAAQDGHGAAGEGDAAGDDEAAGRAEQGAGTGAGGSTGSRKKLYRSAKAKRHYLLTCKVSRYCLLAFITTTVVFNPFY